MPFGIIIVIICFPGGIKFEMIYSVHESIRRTLFEPNIGNQVFGKYAFFNHILK